jgi:hypothetical protein
MTETPRSPYCLSRQHPELAAGSPASRNPINNRKNEPLPAPPAPPPPRPETPPRKHL